MTPGRPGCRRCYGTGKIAYYVVTRVKYERCRDCLGPSLKERLKGFLRDLTHSLKWRAATAVVLYFVMRR